MTDHEYCPHCGASQRGKEIPEADRQYYSYQTHFSLTIGNEIRGVYDGVLFWSCRNCGGAWHRFPKGHHLHARAEPYLIEIAKALDTVKAANAAKAEAAS